LEEAARAPRLDPSPRPWGRSSRCRRAQLHSLPRAIRPSGEHSSPLPRPDVSGRRPSKPTFGMGDHGDQPNIGFSPVHPPNGGRAASLIVLSSRPEGRFVGRPGGDSASGRCHRLVG
jgi:hypothetical protein